MGLACPEPSEWNSETGRLSRPHSNQLGCRPYSVERTSYPIPSVQALLKTRRFPRLRKIRHLARRAGQFEDVQAGVGPVGDVDIAAVVHIDVVGLDCDFALFIGVLADAALVGI